MFSSQVQWAGPLQGEQEVCRKGERPELFMEFGLGVLLCQASRGDLLSKMPRKALIS